jgi:hypothetical protein
MAMSDSKLLPRTLRRPLYALLWGNLASLVSLIPAMVDVTFLLLWPCIIGIYALLSYCIQIYGFLILRLKLESLPREFRSPFGVAGAAYSFAVFLLGIVSGLSCRAETMTTIVVIAVYLVVMSVYYHAYAKHAQTFSAAEKILVLPAHVVILNANGKRCVFLLSLLSSDISWVAEYLYSKYSVLGAIASCCYGNRPRQQLGFDKVKRFWPSSLNAFRKVHPAESTRARDEIGITPFAMLWWQSNAWFRFYCGKVTRSKPSLRIVDSYFHNDLKSRFRGFISDSSSNICKVVPAGYHRLSSPVRLLEQESEKLVQDVCKQKEVGHRGGSLFINTDRSCRSKLHDDSLVRQFEMARVDEGLSNLSTSRAFHSEPSSSCGHRRSDQQMDHGPLSTGTPTHIDTNSNLPQYINKARAFLARASSSSSFDVSIPFHK